MSNDIQKIRMLLEMKEYELSNLGGDLLRELEFRCKRDKEILRCEQISNFDEYPKIMECVAKKINKFVNDIKACGNYSRIFKFTEKLKSIFYEKNNCIIFLEDGNDIHFICGFEKILKMNVSSYPSECEVYFIDCDYLYNFLSEQLL